MNSQQSFRMMETVVELRPRLTTMVQRGPASIVSPGSLHVSRLNSAIEAAELWELKVRVEVASMVTACHFCKIHDQP
jgi:hypothetical protein